MLEQLMDMTTNELALAFHRITGHHTKPKLIFSDNAPQIELLEKILESTYTHEWTWKRIPPGASWMAGSYERIVALPKQALLHIFHGKSQTDSQFRTALVEIANQFGISHEIYAEVLV